MVKDTGMVKVWPNVPGLLDFLTALLPAMENAEQAGTLPWELRGFILSDESTTNGPWQGVTLSDLVAWGNDVEERNTVEWPSEDTFDDDAGSRSQRAVKSFEKKKTVLGVKTVKKEKLADRLYREKKDATADLI